jgi:putative DNA primase/helicase
MMATDQELDIRHMVGEDEYSSGSEPTDLGNSDRFLYLYRDRVRYSVKHGVWLIWDNRRWAIDELGAIDNFASKAVRSILLEASSITDKDEMTKLTKWAMRSQDKTQIEHMLALARNRVAVLIDELDSDPWLLNCKNGTIDLRTGELQPHSLADMIIKMVNANFDKGAKCPKWMSFLDRIMGGNVDMINFLQRAVGYSITGLTVEQCFFILHGIGANGKSTFIETLASLLGNGYAAGTPTDTIMIKRFESGIPNDVARLKGARFVSINEVEKGRRMAESKVKQMTGGDRLTARFMRGEYFDFYPEFKLWLRANHKPIISGTDNAMWRRIRFIPFEVAIPENEQNPFLQKELTSEYNGILAWIVQGCLDWQKMRLQPPEKVTRATADYRDDQDVIGSFLKEKTEAGEYVYSKILYMTYTNWCEGNGDRPITQRSFSQALTEKGYESKHKENGTAFLGLSIVENG